MVNKNIFRISETPDFHLMGLCARLRVIPGIQVFLILGFIFQSSQFPESYVVRM